MSWLLQFTAFIHNGQLKDMICFYDTAERKYYNIMQLGRCALSMQHLLVCTHEIPASNAELRQQPGAWKSTTAYYNLVAHAAYAATARSLCVAKLFCHICSQAQSTICRCNSALPYACMHYNFVNVASPSELSATQWPLSLSFSHPDIHISCWLLNQLLTQSSDCWMQGGLWLSNHCAWRVHSNHNGWNPGLPLLRIEEAECPALLGPSVHSTPWSRLQSGRRCCCLYCAVHGFPHWMYRRGLRRNSAASLLRAFPVFCFWCDCKRL